MTFNKALTQLKTTGTLTTEIISPLGVTFEQFLRFSQLSPERQNNAIQRLIAKLSRR